MRSLAQVTHWLLPKSPAQQRGPGIVRPERKVGGRVRIGTLAEPVRRGGPDSAPVQLLQPVQPDGAQWW